MDFWSLVLNRMTFFSKQVAVITGASSGIGRAVAVGLAEQGAYVCLVGRNSTALGEVAKKAKFNGSRAAIYLSDLAVDENIRKLARDIEKDMGYVDILIHCAGAMLMGDMEHAPVEDFDFMYKINVRSPYILTQALLSSIKTRSGQIVFMNSSVGLKSRANVGQYAATKHALKAMADTLREEVNSAKVRVLSVYPGRTATPMQQYIHEHEKRTYDPQRFVQPPDIAEVIISALSLPRSAEVTDINIRPMLK